MIINAMAHTWTNIYMTYIHNYSDYSIVISKKNYSKKFVIT